MPYPDFSKSASVLDYRRLGKQRVECKQILNALLGNSDGWVNHPATKMWQGHEISLCRYAIKICEEWRNRGYNDSLLPFFTELLSKLISKNLNKEDPKWIGQFEWSENPDKEYIWPK